MSWNTVWSSTTLNQLVSAAEFNNFIRALNERTFTTFVHLNEIDPASSPVPIWNSATLVSVLQNRAEALTGGYRKREAWEGKAYVSGVHPTVQWTVADVFAALGRTGWPRKYPREINGAGTAYTDGSAFANGHLARDRSNGRVYLRSGGAWVLQALDVQPDVISTTGYCTAGDYVIPDIFNALRDYINLLDVATMTLTSSSWFQDAGDGGVSFPSGIDPSWTTAKAQAEANYSTAGSTAGAANVRSNASGELRLDGNYAASQSRIKGYLRNVNAAAAPVGSKVRFFYVVQPAGGQNFVDFDGVGAASQWHEIGSGVTRLATPTTVSSGKIGGTGLAPWCPQPTGAAGTAGAKNDGYNVVAQAAIWDARDGGFQYTSTSP